MDFYGITMKSGGILSQKEGPLRVFTAYDGGAAGALDSVDGNLLSDLDAAIVVTADKVYFYSLDADSAAGESPPDIIAPDNNPGDKRWILLQVHRAMYSP